MLSIHQQIQEKLDYFYKIHKIPNILFHGPSGSGKRTLVNEFIHKIYNNNKEQIKTFTLFVNCSHGVGIKFIREELKFFAKTNIQSNFGNQFKSIILFNAEKLTMDAQSALRRCIEVFSHNTRFFIVTEDKYKVMKPILSRFCEMYIPELETVNLYKYNIDKTFGLQQYKKQRLDNLKRDILKCSITINNLKTNTNNNNNTCSVFFMQMSLNYYERGYSALDILQLLENHTFLETIINMERRYELLLYFHRVKKEIRNEKILIMFILHFVFLSSIVDLENICFI
jgi:hypothetical protein